MVDRVWVGQAESDLRNAKRFNNNISLHDLSLAASHSRKQDLGQALTPDEIPTWFKHDYTQKFTKKLPAMLSGNYLLVVREDVADIMRQFDLGEGGLTPVKYYQFDEKTEIPGSYFALNIGAAKSSFLPDESRNLKVNFLDVEDRGDKPNIYQLAFQPKHGDVAVSPAALEGPDIWKDNRRFLDATFFSDRLYQALKAEGLHKRLYAYSCRVIDKTPEAGN